MPDSDSIAFVSGVAISGVLVLCVMILIYLIARD
jgi:hypothetical protein